MSQSPNPDALPFAPSAERNRGPILEVLRGTLHHGARVLEIGAGTGQHAVAFSAALEPKSWLPTDTDTALPGLIARVNTEGGPGLACPQQLVLGADQWPEGPFDAVYTANTCHIAPWEAVCALFEGAAQVLTQRGKLIIYGPFTVQGRYRSEGDRRFDHALRAEDPAMGIRDLASLEREAGRHHLILKATIDMPANNLVLLFNPEDPEDD